MLRVSSYNAVLSVAKQVDLHVSLLVCKSVLILFAFLCNRFLEMWNGFLPWNICGQLISSHGHSNSDSLQKFSTQSLVCMLEDRQAAWEVNCREGRVPGNLGFSHVYVSHLDRICCIAS